MQTHRRHPEDVLRPNKTQIFDPQLSEQSYGFRLGRSAQRAMRAAQQYAQGGKDSAAHPEVPLAPVAKMRPAGSARCGAWAFIPSCSRQVIPAGIWFMAATGVVNAGLKVVSTSSTWLPSAIQSSSDLRLLSSTAGYGKPPVRRCGMVAGRNPRHSTRSGVVNLMLFINEVWIAKTCLRALREGNPVLAECPAAGLYHLSAERLSVSSVAPRARGRVA
jgi:hypothetical protein